VARIAGLFVCAIADDARGTDPAHARRGGPFWVGAGR